jgi:hypothetical protein
MQRLRGLMNGPDARMAMTIPVGRDAVFAEHRIYGEQRFPRLTYGFATIREAYFVKSAPGNLWMETSRETAFYRPGVSVVLRIEAAGPGAEMTMGSHASDAWWCPCPPSEPQVLRIVKSYRF